MSSWSRYEMQAAAAVNEQQKQTAASVVGRMARAGVRAWWHASQQEKEDIALCKTQKVTRQAIEKRRAIAQDACVLRRAASYAKGKAGGGGASEGWFCSVRARAGWLAGWLAACHGEEGGLGYVVWGAEGRKSGLRLLCVRLLARLAGLGWAGEGRRSGNLKKWKKADWVRCRGSKRSARGGGQRYRI